MSFHIRTKHEGYSASGIRLYHKGGGGGDGGAAQREAERQARINASTAAVNNIFADPSREKIYSTVGNDTRSFYQKQLDEDSAEAARQLKFEKARQGIFGSSQDTDLDRKYQERMDRGLLDVGNRADGAVSGMRSSDEQSRLDIISKILAGMDQSSSISSAQAQLSSNADMQRQNAMSGRMANVFADMFGANNAYQTEQGQQAARDEAGRLGAFNLNNNPYSGSTNP